MNASARGFHKRFLISVALPSLALLLSSCATSELCGDRVVWGPTGDRIKLAKNDELFVCGDPSHPSWKRIPPKQAETFMRSYLESKGYLEPKIKIDYDAGRVTVESGRRAIVTVILTEGVVPPGWKVDPLETSLGQPLEKTTLDTIEQDAIGVLKTMGYACADLDLRAHPDGRVILKLKPGQPTVFAPAFNAGDYPIADDILERYEPFSAGDPYSIKKTILAARRMEGAGVVSSANYLAECEPAKTESPTESRLVRLERNASFGPKRSWEIGFGASTEEYPLAFVRWKNNRLWSSASQFQAEIFGSNIRQKIGGEFKYYHSSQDRRLFLRPGFQIERRQEKQYEIFETRATGFYGRTIDLQDWTLEPEIGLAIRRFRTTDIAAPRTDLVITPEIQLGARTHDFELFRGSPRTGLESTVNYSFLSGGQAGSITTHRLYIQGTALYNYKSYVDPRWVLGLRFTAGSIMTSDGSIPDENNIPPDWLFLAGGDRDLRGFARNSLPNKVRGSGSILTTGVESRWPGQFSFPLEPLVFTDFGYLGNGNARWESPLHIAPGVGFRSATPLGTIRGTIARGMVPSIGLKRWQLFFSFGTEF